VCKPVRSDRLILSELESRLVGALLRRSATKTLFQSSKFWTAPIVARLGLRDRGDRLVRIRALVVARVDGRNDVVVSLAGRDAGIRV
jgi:hypothetical protein